MPSPEVWDGGYRHDDYAVPPPRDVETDCVPLCGADRAAGVPVDWWKHEVLCPAREARKPCQTCHGESNDTPSWHCPDCKGPT